MSQSNGAKPPAPPQLLLRVPIGLTLREARRRYVLATYLANGCNVSQTARVLQAARGTVQLYLAEATPAERALLTAPPPAEGLLQAVERLGAVMA